ncbi:hypothetical protein KY363_01975 [Candidatus Woesearchaeota archaeon]|nr:hypothetical protein [Candidatus Woesearchaeota archaeon]
MQDYEEEDEFFDDESEDDAFSMDDETEDDDPKGAAFMRGVEEAVKIRDATEDEEEEF